MFAAVANEIFGISLFFLAFIITIAACVATHGGRLFFSLLSFPPAKKHANIDVEKTMVRGYAKHPQLPDGATH